MVRNELRLSLNIGKCQFADFIAFTIISAELPLYTLKLKEKVQNIESMYKIDECIPHVALGLKKSIKILRFYFQIHGKIEIVVMPLVIFINHL